MSLLSATPADPGAKRAEAVKNVPLRAQQLAKIQLQQLVKMQKNASALIWKHPVLQPQEVLDALGTDASSAVQAHGQLTESIRSIASTLGVGKEIGDALAKPEGQIKVHGNGTAVVLESK